MKSPTGLIATACSLVILGACAGEAKKPTEQVARANTLIEQAEKAGAQRYAAEELQRARNKLQSVGEAVEKGDSDRARYLAEQAAVDAELASALTLSGEAQRAAEEVEKSTATLQEEAERNSTAEPESTTR